MKNAIAALAVVVLTGCNNPTPKGTVLLKQKLDHSLGGAPAGSPETAPKQVTSKVRIAADAAEVEVRLDVVEVPQGRFLSAVEVAVTDNGGGEVTAVIPPGASPVNRGTAEAVLASQRVRVEWRKNGFGGSTLRQTDLEVRGDGSVSAE